MKLVIFGATGAVGKELVRAAIDDGHTVTAFVRDASKLPMTHAQLIPYKGNILSFESVEGAIEGQDAVLCTLGTRSLKKSSVLTEGVAQILRAMQKQNVRRFIYMSAHGAGDSYMQAPLFTKLAITYLLKNIFAEKAVQEKAIKQTALDWTIVHATTLIGGSRTGKYKASERLHVHSLSFISRANVADFLLRQLGDMQYHRKIVVISS